MLDERVKFLYRYWYQRAQSESSRSSGVTFFYYYFCLNILMAHLSSKNQDSEMKKWLKLNNNLLKDAFTDLLNSKSFLEYLYSLKKLSPITDNRNNNQKRKVVITDPQNFDQILDAIYQIRCNFFHGTKNLDEKRDVMLIEYSTRILEKWIGAIYLSLF